MKRLHLVALAAILTLPVSAGPADYPALESYLAKTLTLCPGARTVLETVDVAGPRNFNAYRITMSSSDEYCQERAFALHSPVTGQVLVGQIVPLDEGATPVADKVQKLLEERMKLKGSSKILDQKLPDGLKRVKITKSSPSGDVTLYGYVDASEKFFILGRRGELGTDPTRTLLENLDAAKAASRGPRGARIEILELSDFQCPACRRAHQILEPYVEKFGDQIHYRRLDLPITDFHDWAMKASLGAQAMRAVAPQHYWRYVDYIFTNQPNITAATIDTVVRDFVEGVGIDWKTFQPHYDSPSTRDRLNRQTGRAFENNIFGTPTILVNGRSIYYGDDASGLKAYLEQLFGKLESARD